VVYSQLAPVTIEVESHYMRANPPAPGQRHQHTNTPKSPPLQQPPSTSGHEYQEVSLVRPEKFLNDCSTSIDPVNRDLIIRYHSDIWVKASIHFVRVWKDQRDIGI
jgi:hypothetical protein